MSRLQKLVNSLISLITTYSAIQTSEKYPLEPLLKKSQSKLIEALDEIINKATTKKGYDKRRPLLDYIFYEIKLLKPLVDKDEPLTKEEYKNVRNHLVVLINTTRKILQALPTEIVSVNYNNEKIDLVGTVYYSLWPKKSYCRSGDIICQWYADPRVFPQYEFDAKDFISELVEEHQNALLVPSLEIKNKKLEEQNLGLQDDSKELRENAELLKEATFKLEGEKSDLEIKLKELRAEHEKTTDELERLLDEVGSLKNNSAPKSTTGPLPLPTPFFMGTTTTRNSSNSFLPQRSVGGFPFFPVYQATSQKGQPAPAKTVDETFNL